MAAEKCYSSQRKAVAQYKVEASVLSLMQHYISGLKPDTRACSSHPNFGDYPAFSEISLRLIKFPYADPALHSYFTLCLNKQSLQHRFGTTR